MPYQNGDRRWGFYGRRKIGKCRGRPTLVRKRNSDVYFYLRLEQNGYE